MALFWQERRSALLGGAAMMAMTLLAGIALLGLSGWFITATALAGLSGAALAFDVFIPGAGIRLLALVRTGARYGERLVTHDATLRVLAGLRERLFRGHATTEGAEALQRRPARLLFRLTSEVDALDSLYLRVLAPLTAALLVSLAVLAGLWLAAPALAWPLLVLLLLAGGLLPWWIAHAALRPGRRRAAAIEALRSRAIDAAQGQVDLLMAGRTGAQAASIMAADARLAAAEDALSRLETRGAALLFLAGQAALVGTLLIAAPLRRRASSRPHRRPGAAGGHGGAGSLRAAAAWGAGTRPRIAGGPAPGATPAGTGGTRPAAAGGTSRAGAAPAPPAAALPRRPAAGAGRLQLGCRRR
ncbi:hypothetical protein ACFQU7_06760 [Pseudoroseomonas wenyumeiae]